MIKLSWKQIAAWRARRHHLDRRARAGSWLGVASRICGLHAQVLSSAELSLWTRVEDFERGMVQRALWEERTLVKTWAMRGTLHLLPASELPVWNAALSSSRRYRAPGFWKRCCGITLEEVDRLTEAVGVALDGRVMTREELAAEIGRLTESAALANAVAQGGWGTILKPAAFAGRLCFAPSVGQRVRFTRPDTWLDSAQVADPQTAAATVARRYLAAYGPATYRDLSQWWGGGTSTTRQWITSLGDEVCSVDVEGGQAWMLAADAREARESAPSGSVRLLPGFDQYVVAASAHAENLFPYALRGRVYRPQGWISPVLLVDGFIQGTWRHEVKSDHVEVKIEPFSTLPVRERESAEQEAERLARFLGCSLDFSCKRGYSRS